MIDQISRRFGVSASKLRKAEVFDAYIGNQLFVDPVLLRTAGTPEFRKPAKNLRITLQM